MSPGRFISLVLYGVLCALLGGVAYRRGLGPIVARLARFREHVKLARFREHVNAHGWPSNPDCEECNNGIDAVGELVDRFGPIHRAQHERRP